jgi:hypothetical protein
MAVRIGILEPKGRVFSTRATNAPAGVVVDDLLSRSAMVVSRKEGFT